MIVTRKNILEDIVEKVQVKKVKRQDSNRTDKAKAISIERRNIRKNIARNGGRF